MRVVVLGAGSAGCVVAARLSEEPGVEVVLLEAGPHYRPGRWPAQLAHGNRLITDTHDWGLRAQAGASPRIVHVPRGKVVGGSSVTNAAIALRGLAEHYDEWDEHVDGYGWSSWLPWFRAVERDLDFPGAPWHGDAGPIPIARYPRREWYPVLERFRAAAEERGHPWVEDHNAPGAVGVGPVPLNVVGGLRQTPADHYLAPALARPNLRLVTGVTVDRLVLREGRAVAVVGIDARGRARAWEADHAILCLGTYASPAALLRSGVGPERELARHGIRTAVHLPGVGEGMQDHPKIPYRFWLDPPLPREPHPWIQALLTAEVEVAGEGRLIQVMPYVGLVDGGHVVTDLNVQVADARGRRGRVALQGRDPRLQPRLWMGWLEEGGDLEAAVAAGREAMALAAAGPLAEVLRPLPHLGDDQQPLRAVETFHHPVGSLRMGREDDPGAVLDGEGRVRGLQGVWCMDASAIPRLPSTNVHLCVLALAERLAAGFLRRARG